MIRIKKYNVTLLREILLLGKIPYFFIKALSRDREYENTEFKLYNYNGVNITCSSVCQNSPDREEYIFFDMENYSIKVSLEKQQMLIEGDYKKVFNKKIIDGIVKFDNATTDVKVSIINELKREIRKIKEV